MVITANQRTARELRREHDRAESAAGARVWEPAEVLSWESWTASLWRGLLLDGQVTGMLLNRSQELAVWRGVVGEDSPETSETVRWELAAMAAETWARLEAYGGSGRLRSYEGNADMAAFARWARIFERRCRAEGYVSRSSVEAMLRPEVEAGRVRLPAGGLELVGFDEVLPARRALLDAVERRGIPVAVGAVPEPGGGERFLAAAADEAEELRSCALWIRRLLEAEPEARVGVIVPELAERRAAIDRSFRRILAPELESLGAAGADAGGPYEFSLGVPLGRTPAGAAALALLRWAAGPLEAERVSALLLSPYVGGVAGIAGERHARASLDAFGRRRREALRPEMREEEVVRLVRGSRWREQVPAMLEALGRFAAAAGRCEAEAVETYSGWTEVMRELLGAMRWSEGAGDGSVAFQTVQKWESALDELATMDFAGRTIPYLEALEELERIADETIFAPESRGAAVQVMGPMEAAGSRFDAVWVMGAGDGGWPPREKGSPLLPWGLRRELRMPGTDVRVDAERGRAMTERIAASAPRAVFSYAVETAAGRQRASAALDGMRLETVAAAESAGGGGSPEEVVPVALESFEDTVRVPVPRDEVFRGGARVLEEQAACGFRAFAQLRLVAGALDAADLGWDSRRRGTLVHRVLELFWGKVQTQARLLAMTVAERDACLSETIAEALRRSEEAVAWDAAYVEVQRERLLRLLGEWLAMEATRAPFVVLRREELLRDVEIGPLRLDVRVDRVDRTEHGEVLIDYKTGVAKASEWAGERPDKPQLPLYAILAGAERLEGVAFGSVRAGKDMRLEGYAEHDQTLPKRARHGFRSLEEQVEDWREILTGLAEEFYRGDTRVNPKSYPRTCQYCAARILCRLDAAELEMDEDDDGQEQNDPD